MSVTETGRSIFYIQIFSFVMFSVILIRIPSVILAVLFREVPFNKYASTNEMIELVAKWSKYYLLVGDLIADINHFLGPPLVLFMGFSFFTFIGYSFIILDALITTTETPLIFLYDDIFTTILNVISVALLAYVSENIPQQVTEITRLWNSKSKMNMNHI